MAAHTKDHLIEATIALITESRDLRQISSRAIAQRAGTALGAITYHFGGKDELVQAAVCRFIDRVLGAWAAAEREPVSPHTIMEAMARMADFMWEHPRPVRISIQSDLDHPSSGDNTRRAIAQLSELITRCGPVAGSPEGAMTRAACLVYSLQGEFMRDHDGAYREPAKRRQWIGELVGVALDGPWRQRFPGMPAPFPDWATADAAPLEGRQAAGKDQT